MAEITAAAVKQLREMTDLPMMDCKKALTEAGGDQEKALALLKEWGKKVMVKRSENSTQEGLIVIEIKPDGSEAAMIELQCESAPVAVSEDFNFLANQCIKQLLNGPGAATPEELLAQAAPDRPGQSLNDLLGEVVNKIREKMVLAKIARVTGPVGGYVHHDKKNGVLFRAEGAGKSSEVLRDVAMHIAALKPKATHPTELPQELVAAERAKLTEEALKSGKPAAVVEKIVEGRLKNFYVEQGVLFRFDNGVWNGHSRKRGIEL
ncbi:translation elongation factor Ts, partial [Planctopirus hydrillae]